MTLSLISAAPGLAAAQDDTPPAIANPASVGTEVFDQAYFARYSLQTAEDMLRRLPAAQPILDAATQNQARGLGSGGDQILIGGKRMAQKGQILASLRRIPATTVERIELIRGTSSDIEVLSEGLVINIVLKAGAKSNSPVGNFELNFKFDNQGYSRSDWLVSYAGSIGRLGFVLGAERAAWTPLGVQPTGGNGDYSRRFRDERYYYPSGALQELRPQKWRRAHGKKIFTANFSYAFDNGDQARLNLLWQPFPINETDITAYTRFSPAGAITSTGVDSHRRHNYRDTKDFGGELQKRLGRGTLNLVGIHTLNLSKTVDYRTRRDSAAGSAELTNSLTRQKTREDILRLTYNLRIAKGQELTVGAEGARNTLAQDLATGFDFNRDGWLEPVDLGVTAYAEVQEKRGEVFATHNWTINSKATLESTLTVEASRVTTNFVFVPVHSYRFVKPRLDFRYSLTPRDRLRIKVERAVSQLEFNNFVPVFNVVDNRIDAGNPEIAPDRTWIYEAGIEHTFAGSTGRFEAKAFYRDISGHIDRGPFAFNAAGLPTSAPINIDKTRLYGVEFRTGIKLGFLGAPNFQITSRFVPQVSRVVDPFTGRDRKMKDPYSTEFNLGFRHDLTAARFAYGANLVDTGGFQLLSDVRNREYYSRAARFDVFAEKGIGRGMTLRAEAYNLSGSREYKQRSLYLVSQANGALSRTETYQETRDRRFAIRLRGKF